MDGRRNEPGKKEELANEQKEEEGTEGSIYKYSLSRTVSNEQNSREDLDDERRLALANFLKS